jgi:hypothetical protein
VAWILAVTGWKSQRKRFAPSIDKELSKITGPFFAAGWSPAAVVRAFQVQPDGTPWPGPLPTPDQRDSPHQPRIRNLWAVLTFRLAAWRDPLGYPLTPPIPTERTRRGRPRKPPVPAPTPAPRTRGRQVEAELAAFRARDNQRRAQRAADAAIRESRRSVASRPAEQNQNPQGPLPAYFRAQVERRTRDRGGSHPSG